MTFEMHEYNYANYAVNQTLYILIDFFNTLLFDKTI
jgi:hypothetical protein